MGKIKIDESERFPFFTVGDEYGIEFDRPEEQVARWRQVMADFEAVQDEMEDLYEAARKAEEEQRAVARAEREAAEKAEEAERQKVRAAEQRKRAKAVERLVGTVYDVDGNPVGEVTNGRTGLHVSPIVERTNGSPDV